MLKIGDAFLFAVKHSHLWIVISNPHGDEGHFVMVNLTTQNDYTPDKSCILQPNDYPHFIKHASSVYYVDSKFWWVNGAKGYTESEAKGVITSMPNVGINTLLKIQQGALKSDFFVPDHVPHVKASLVKIIQPPPRPPSKIPQRTQFTQSSQSLE